MAIYKSIIDSSSISAKYYDTYRLEYKIKDITKHIKHIKRHKVIPFNLQQSIIDLSDRVITKVDSENIIAKFFRDVFTFNNRKEIKYLMQLGYTRIESKNIINAICTLKTSAEDRVELIRDYPDKIQKTQGYTSNSEYQQELSDTTNYAEKTLRYKDDVSIYKSLLYLQKLSASREDFKKIVSDIPHRVNFNKGYETEQEVKTLKKQTDNLLINLNFDFNNILFMSFELTEKLSCNKLKEQLESIQKALSNKDKHIKILRGNGFSQKDAERIFRNLAIRFSYNELLEKIENYKLGDNDYEFEEENWQDQDSAKDAPSINSRATEEELKYLEILGFSREKFSDKIPTFPQIRKAYKKTIIKMHPDKNPGKDTKEDCQKVVEAMNYFENHRLMNTT